jgi:hypothetical protein
MVAACISCAGSGKFMYKAFKAIFIDRARTVMLNMWYTCQSYPKNGT